jgi:hypothetical protein
VRSDHRFDSFEISGPGLFPSSTGSFCHDFYHSILLHLAHITFTLQEPFCIHVQKTKKKRIIVCVCVCVCVYKVLSCLLNHISDLLYSGTEWTIY